MSDMEYLRQVYADEFGEDQIDTYERWVSARALRHAVKDSLLAGGMSDRQFRDWLEARADTIETP